ncbi:MAG: hypothetical protein AAF229_06510 [Pseudomonadota bacterium]
MARAFCIALLLLITSAVTARCTDTPRDTYLEELNRIAACLKDAARKPATAHNLGEIGFDETRLYTWGPQVKIDRMRTGAYFCDYEYARQREFEAIKFYNLPQTNVQRWYGWQPPGAEGPVRTLSQLGKLNLQTPEQRRLSLQFVFPRWFDRTPNIAARESHVREQAADSADQPASPARAITEGRLAAYDMAQEGRPSSIKGGLGVYFAADPFRYHAPGAREHALVCDVPRQAVIVDLANAEVAEMLERQNILYDETPKLPATSLVNRIENPLAFDDAARGDTILRLDFGEDLTLRPRDRAYVDKCVIQYTQCRALSVGADSLSCADFQRLVRLERDGGGALTVSPPSSYRIGPGVMGAMLRQPNFSQDFRAQLHKCLGLEVTPRLVALLESHYGTGIGQALARDQDAADATP